MCGPLHSHVRRRCIIPADGFYEGGEAKGSDVDLPEEPEAVRPGWPMGRVAQAEQEAGGVVHRHYEPNELDGLFTTACLFSSDRETKSNGLMLLERLSLKPSRC